MPVLYSVTIRLQSGAAISVTVSAYDHMAAIRSVQESHPGSSLVSYTRIG